MNKYYFNTPEFGVSDNGVHLLRSGFNYRTIGYSEIKRARIIKGKELDNWFLIFLIGFIVLLFGLILSFRVISSLMTEQITTTGRWRMGYFLLIPIVGGFFVYQSFQTGLLLKLEFTDNRISKFPLRQIVKENRLSEFEKLFKEKLQSRISPEAEKYVR